MAAIGIPNDEQFATLCLEGYDGVTDDKSDEIWDTAGTYPEYSQSSFLGTQEFKEDSMSVTKQDAIDSFIGRVMLYRMQPNRLPVNKEIWEVFKRNSDFCRFNEILTKYALEDESKISDLAKRHEITILKEEMHALAWKLIKIQGLLMKKI